MELYEYWRILVRFSPILILTSIIGLSGATYLNFVTVPIYNASADVFVTTPTVALDVGSLATGSNFTEQRVVSYAQIISGPATLEPVIKQLGLDVTPSELANDIHASAPNGTVLIRIEVTSKDPNKAAAIANAVAVQFEKTVQELELTSADTGTNIKVTPVRSALPNYTPSSPKKSLNIVLGLILGFGVGASIITIILFFDRTVKNEDHLEKLPLLGTIRFDATARDKPLLSDLSKYSARAEAFRQLRTNLQLSESNARTRLLAISSALPNEGKTTTALNLALSLSDSGLQVALVDSDLRRPQLNLFLELDSGLSGVSEICTNKAMMSNFRKNPRSFMHEVNPRFSVLTSGSIPSNAAELVGSDEFKVLLDSLKRNFDIIILDCPPTLPIADAAVISSVIDGILIVVKAGKTTIKQFKGAIATLKNVDANIIGCVLNMIPTNRRADEYGYRYGYGYRSYYSYKGIKSGKSLYSPVEPYGPALEFGQKYESVNDDSNWIESSDLQEMHLGQSEMNSNATLRIKRTVVAVYNKLHQKFLQLEHRSNTKLTTGDEGDEYTDFIVDLDTRDINLDNLSKIRKIKISDKFGFTPKSQKYLESSFSRSENLEREDNTLGNDVLKEIINKLSTRDVAAHKTLTNQSNIKIKSETKKRMNPKVKRIAKKTAKKTAKKIT